MFVLLNEGPHRIQKRIKALPSKQTWKTNLPLAKVIAVNQVIEVNQVIAMNQIIEVNQVNAVNPVIAVNMKKAMAWCGLLSQVLEGLGSRAWARGLDGLGSRV